MGFVVFVDVVGLVWYILDGSYGFIVRYSVFCLLLVLSGFSLLDV